MAREFAPPFTTLDHRDRSLQERGYAVLDPSAVAEWLGTDPVELSRLHTAWSGLPIDAYLRDGGSYRRRRHGCYVVDGDDCQAVAHRAHWQPLEYNALHGGMQRWFEPLLPELTESRCWPDLLQALAAVASNRFEPRPWYLEAHAFRIDTSGGIGRPTPEGAHRDGVDLVAVFMLQRHNIKGGESRVFEAEGPAGQRFTLHEPWSLLLLDDARVIHETTPIQPEDPGQLGWRDTLVITCRRDGFQGD